MKPNIILSFEDAQRLFDMIVSTMDFGSGFLETDDVDLLRKVAKLIDVDPMEATPSTFKTHYKHPFKPRPGEILDKQAKYIEELQEFLQRSLHEYIIYPKRGRPVTIGDVEGAQKQFEFLKNTCEHCSERLNHEVHREM